jgi:hypothetical protein
LEIDTAPIDSAKLAVTAILIKFCRVHSAEFFWSAIPIDFAIIPSVPDDLRQLAAAIHRDRAERARHMPFQEKFLAGGDLFDAACEVTRSGIRADHPDFTDAQVLDELRRRLERRRVREYRNPAAKA